MGLSLNVAPGSGAGAAVSAHAAGVVSVPLVDDSAHYHHLRSSHSKTVVPLVMMALTATTTPSNQAAFFYSAAPVCSADPTTTKDSLHACVYWHGFCSCYCHNDIEQRRDAEAAVFAEVVAAFVFAGVSPTPRWWWSVDLWSYFPSLPSPNLLRCSATT